MTRRRRVGLTLALAVVATLTVPISSASAARDPLAEAQAKITAAQVAADNAAAEYGDAEARYSELQDDVRRTEQLLVALHAEVSRLTSIVRRRASVIYMGGSRLPLDDLLGSSGDALDAARRAVLADRANASSNQAVQQLGGATDDLGARERELREEIARQANALRDLRARQDEVQRSLESARDAEQALRTQLERERRLEEYATLVRQAQAAARARAASEAAKRAAAEAARRASTRTPSTNGGGGTSTDGGAGQIIGIGSWVCPVQGTVSFTDTYGAPRSGGRTHKGVDMFAARGTPTVAVVAGSVFFQSDPLGGLAAYVNGNDGNTYYYAHLNDYVGGARSVAAGEVVGHVGDTGTTDAPPHLHFEIRLGGPNGTRINPYPTVRSHC